MAARALAPFVADHLTLHFVANVDGADLGDTLPKLPLATTLFIVCSKTFTTLETMTNAADAHARLVASASSAKRLSPAHFCAVSTALDKVATFGIAGGSRLRILGLGRRPLFALVVDRPLACDRHRRGKVREIALRGGQDIDKHFATTPLEQNVPV